MRIVGIGDSLVNFVMQSVGRKQYISVRLKVKNVSVFAVIGRNFALFLGKLLVDRFSYRVVIINI